MAPQPLRSIRKKPLTVRMGGDPLLKRPEMAAELGRAIAQWSLVETLLGDMLSTMLSADPKPALAMFSAIVSTTAQRSALEAVASSVLEHDDARNFRAIMRIFSRVGAERNKLAHWVFGIADELPDALLLLEPKHWRAGTAATITAINAGRASIHKERAKPVWDNAYVYKKADIADISDRAMSLARIISLFQGSIDPHVSPDLRDARRRELPSEHLMAEALAAVDQRTQSPLSRQPPQGRRRSP